MIQVDGITKLYGEFVAINGLFGRYSHFHLRRFAQCHRQLRSAAVDCDDHRNAFIVVSVAWSTTASPRPAQDLALAGDCWAGCSNASTFALNSVEVAFIVGYPLISLIDLKYDTH